MSTNTNTNKCNCKCDEMFYFRVKTFEERSVLATMLTEIGYSFIDMTGGQAAFEPLGTFYKFESFIKRYCELVDIKVLEIKECEYPGLGLFD